MVNLNKELIYNKMKCKDGYILLLSCDYQSMALNEDEILQLNGVIPDLSAKIMQRRAEEKSRENENRNDTD